MSNPPKDGRIVKAAIYPPIGIARLGNSAEEHFIGPEVIDPPPQPHSYYRDANGALKRQAARFRVFGLDAQNQPVEELGLPDAKIEWTVHLVNMKAAWYQFQAPLDIPESAMGPASMLRNALVSNRRELIIDPGPRSIGGPDLRGQPDYIFDTGQFKGDKVYLGELRTVPDGSLLVLGGRGVSRSASDGPITCSHNNEGWYDDISDGPVTAKVWYQGKEIPTVVPAWVVVAPPNYAPRQKSVCTMWDVIRDLSIQNTTAPFPLLPFPDPPSFNHDIRPIFERLSNLQWVNPAYAAAFGWGGPHHFATPAMLARLSSTSSAYQALRQTIANQFRDPRPAPAGDPYSAAAPQLWPWLIGDADNSPTPSPRQFASLTRTQLQILKVNWVQGKFKDDYDPGAPPVREVGKLPPAERADMLTRAALEFCAADALNPGIELTWNMRSSSLYMPGFPFRVMPAQRGWTEPEIGIVFNINADIRAVGPLGPQVPGGLTRWLAVPWQASVGACKLRPSGTYDPNRYAPTWWPARVPNQVITPRNYDKIRNKRLPLPDRLAAFAEREDWIGQPLPVLGKVPQADEGEAGVMHNVVKHFGQMGVVVEMPGPGPDPGSTVSHFPEVLQVSDRNSPSSAPAEPVPPGRP